MAQRARVTSVDEIRRFRVALGSFVEDCQGALISIRAEISRTQNWIERDQLPYWKQMVKKCTKDLGQARNDLNRKEMTSNRTVDEQRAVERAKRRLEEAQMKLQVVKKWSKMLPNELDRLVGGVRSLSSTVDREGPAAVDRLGEFLQSIESYLALSMPTSESRRAATSTADSTETEMSDEPKAPEAAKEDKS